MKKNEVDCKKEFLKVADWLEEGGKTEIDKAKDKAKEILKTHHPESLIFKDYQNLLEIIKKAENSN